MGITYYKTILLFPVKFFAVFLMSPSIYCVTIILDNKVQMNVHYWLQLISPLHTLYLGYL